MSEASEPSDSVMNGRTREASASRSVDMFAEEPATRSIAGPGDSRSTS